MKAFVTGATGLLGNAVTRTLAQRGHDVTALVRGGASRAGRLLPGAIRVVDGDLTEPASYASALGGVDWVFHCAGMPQQWQRDPSIFDRVNRQGTANVLQAAAAAGVRRVIYTSTDDVFVQHADGTVDEAELDQRPRSDPYERSKQRAEEEVARARAQGLDVVTLHPSGIYGPGPVNVALNSFFIDVLNRKVPMLPPARVSIVFIAGVVDAHLAAAERAPRDARYIVSDEHVPMRDLAAEILRAGAPEGKRRLPPTAPPFVLKALAAVTTPVARTLGTKPIVAPGALSWLLADRHDVAARARAELGFTPTPLALGVRETVAHLRSQGLVP